MNIVDKIRQEVIARSEQHQQEVEDYDFWREHIDLVVKNALQLAEKYNADKEIVELGALLHDIALVSRIGNRAIHNETGAEIAVELLTENNYPKNKMERVRGCVLHHRSSKNAVNIEETCVADGDILAHLDNLLMTLECVFYGKKTSETPTIITLEEARKAAKETLEKDFADLSAATKIATRDRFENIMKVLFGVSDEKEG
jgi:uncharacterized protein